MVSIQTQVGRLASRATTLFHSIHQHPFLPSSLSSNPSPRTAAALCELRQDRAFASMRTGPSAGPPLTNPLNIPKWLEKNQHLLKPPVGNYLIYNDPMTVMVVGGPNARTDYHINQTPEFFYQYKGRMLLKTVDQGKFKDIYIGEGELFLLPGGVPHNPVRFADTVGVVIEQPRPEGSLDVLRWYCQDCEEVVHEASFHCTDLGTQIKDAVQSFERNEEARKCSNCGALCNVRPSPEVMERMRIGGNE